MPKQGICKILKESGNYSFYNTWLNMKQRCSNPKHTAYRYYGGRGITFTNEWDTIIGFFNDMYYKYLIFKYNNPCTVPTIDRINNSKGYFKDNCRWATMKEQSNNTRGNILIEHNGISKNITEWAKELGIKQRTLNSRIMEYGWDIGKSINKKVHKNVSHILTYNGETKTLKEWANYLGIAYRTLWCRHEVMKWPIEKTLTKQIKRRGLTSLIGVH